MKYLFTDKKTIIKTNFYRLKQVDKDQTYTYSKIIQVANNIAGSAQMSVYPNPFRAGFIINMSIDKKALPGREILNTAEQVQIRRTVAVNAGTSLVAVDQLNGLIPGMYFVRIVKDGKAITQKIMKQQ